MPWYRFDTKDGKAFLAHVRLGGKKGAPDRCRAPDPWDNNGARVEACCRMASNLCDWPMGGGKTCDRPICEKHAHSIGPNRDLCPEHYAMWPGPEQAGLAL